MIEKKYFPIFIDLSEKKIAVIGGGVIATRRICTLLNFTEHMTVIAPEITLQLQELVLQGRILWQQREYHVEQIADADMVIAATNQPTVNHQIKADCVQIEKQTGRRILVSVIDARELCDFYFPAIVQSEDIVIGINSGGASPAKTKRMREKLEEMLGKENVKNIR